MLLQIQLDDLGIDYIDKRNGLMDAVTIEDARRAAKRLAQGGMLVTVVGQPKGLVVQGTGRLSSVLTVRRFRGQLPRPAMALKQSIDHARPTGLR